MVRNTFLFVFLLISFLLLPIPALAHVLKTDGSIGAVLHIDPDDDPIAGQTATFFFEIKDKQNKFDPQNCTCRVDIYEGGKIIYSDSLFQQGSSNNLSTPLFQYTFPQRDVYQVKLIGNPQSQGQFQPFSLTYDIRVDKIAQPSSASTSSNSSWLSDHALHIGGLIILVIFFIFALFNAKGRKKDG